MRKLIALLLAIAFMATSHATAIINPSSRPLKASELMIPIATNKFISFHDLAYMKVAEYEKFTGEKMGFFKRLQFKITQHKFRKSINADGNISNKKIQKMFAEGTSGFHLGGFALGFLLGLIGVLIAYLIKDDLKPARTKWAWFGLIGAVILSILFFI